MVDYRVFAAVGYFYLKFAYSKIREYADFFAFKALYKHQTNGELL